MLTWIGDKAREYRKRGLGWRTIAAVLVALGLVVGAVIIWWRKRQAAAREHAKFVAQVDARVAAEAARTTADDAQVFALIERAAAAERVADLAAKEAEAAQHRHDEDLSRIERIRSWSDVPGSPRRPGP